MELVRVMLIIEYFQIFFEKMFCIFRLNAYICNTKTTKQGRRAISGNYEKLYQFLRSRQRSH